MADSGGPEVNRALWSHEMVNLKISDAVTADSSTLQEAEAVPQTKATLSDDPNTVEPQPAQFQTAQPRRSPGAEVVGTYELLEQIMLDLRRRDIILAQRVSKAFKAVYDKSHKVQQRLPMRLPPPGQTVFHATPTSQLGPVNYLAWNFRGDHHILKICHFQGRRNSGSAASWRSVVLGLPEVPSNSYGVLSDPSHRPNFAVANKLRSKLTGNLTLGELADLLSEYIGAEYSRIAVDFTFFFFDYVRAES
ncbi:Hypothetical predicted protein [Lecanosticta acicola]|uniref:F-box domain-containing protein n=1 Tax=Lecanosticta acicola TaxID=111012 RepID=A0AAI8YRW4_9PEZI|nr:Hypothetical predicted protein [Lecanosticta acicola]